MQLMSVQPSGTFSSSVVQNFTDVSTQPSAQPVQILPDGQGGVLVSWNKGVGSTYQMWVSHLLNGSQTDSALPGTSSFPVLASMVLGENSTFLAQNNGRIVALDATGATSWTYTSRAQIITALQGGGAVFADNNQIFSLDANGQASVLSTTFGLFAFNYFGPSTWTGFANDGSLAAVFGSAIRQGVTSWPVVTGNDAKQNAPPVAVLRHFVPVQLSGQYSIAQFETDMRQAVPSLRANHSFYTLGEASVASFMQQLDTRVDAMAFLGNPLTFNFSGNPQSIGLCFASDCLEKTASGSDPNYPLVTPAGFVTDLVDASLLAAKTKVVLVAFPDDGAMFEELWSIYSSTPHQSLIVPSTTTDKAQAAQAWIV